MIRLRTAARPCMVGVVLCATLSVGCQSPSADVGKGPHRQVMVKTGFINKRISLPDGTTRRYVVFVPKTYTPDKAWPAILFLHGAGERGSDNKGQVRVGIGKAIRQREATFGFITVMPQCRKKRWWTAQSEKGYALAALAKTREEYAIDPDRVYLTGLSMGGYGTWSLAVDHPGMWAAIVPVCGVGDPRQAKSIAHLPCWCFHGSADATVPVLNSRDMIKALKKAGAKPRYTEYEGVGHNSWDRAYGDDALYRWLLQQRRK